MVNTYLLFCGERGKKINAAPSLNCRDALKQDTLTLQLLHPTVEDWGCKKWKCVEGNKVQWEVWLKEVKGIVRLFGYVLIRSLAENEMRGLIRLSCLCRKIWSYSQLRVHACLSPYNNRMQAPPFPSTTRHNKHTQSNVSKGGQGSSDCSGIERPTKEQERER